MSGACSSHGRDETCIQNCDRKTSREETTWDTIMDVFQMDLIEMWTRFITLRTGTIELVNESLLP
jgi:hypothetical protein